MQGVPRPAPHDVLSGVGTHVVPGCIGLHRVLGCQGDAAHGDHQEDAHLEVAQVQDVMTQAAKAAGTEVRPPVLLQGLVPLALCNPPASRAAHPQIVLLLQLGSPWSPKKAGRGPSTARRDTLQGLCI
jgi:hypothetical protein